MFLFQLRNEVFGPLIVISFKLRFIHLFFFNFFIFYIYLILRDGIHDNMIFAFFPLK